MELAPLERAPREAWRHSGSYAVANDRGVVCLDEGKAVALDLETGAERWRVPATTRHELRLADERVLVGKGANARAYDLVTGASAAMPLELEAPTNLDLPSFRLEQERTALPNRDEHAHTITLVEVRSGEKYVVDEGKSIHPYRLALSRDVAFIGEPDSDHDVTRDGVLVWAAKFRVGRLWELEIATPPQNSAAPPLFPTRAVEQLIPLSNKLLVVTNAAVHCLVAH